MPDLTTIGGRLRWLRSETGLSQRRVAKLAELGDAHVRLIEVEDRDVQGSTATAIAGVFGVTVDWLLNGTGTTPDPSALRARTKGVHPDPDTIPEPPPPSPADTQPIDFRPGDTHEDLEPVFEGVDPSSPEAGNAA